ncbi:2-polyprenyl-6-methoxyphenol hydroxylase-like FAD-dependent oxidoreductase [Streptomyces aurantiacus]|uniref:FAD-dependent monooxygenase n=1 Tax=Streptomyces aurantiacus TaxID=47760 RepID=UPI00278EF603|nr:2-polyprenyl-6-methoxyphenol hydroxylase-like FAD-dependent oxidoreductase [Streptomyces aurantiacus]
MKRHPLPTSSEPVIVIGGGPAGLASAAELAFHGVRSVLVEPRTEVSYARPRAKTTSPRTMEHFRRWGVADEIRRRAPLSPAWNRRVVFCDRLDGTVITEFHEVFGLSDGPHHLFAESGQQVGQPLVEDVLRAHVRSTGLVDLRLGHRVTALREDADSVTVTVEGPDGSTYVLTALYALGCDGGSSLARRTIGAVLHGTSAPAANLNAVFRSAALRPAMGDALHYWAIGPRVPGAVGPLDRAGLWWASLAGVEGSCDAEGAAGLVAALVGRPAAELDIEILSTDPWTPRMLLSDRFGSDRVFLVGESAHLNPPFGGHGFNTCVGDAVNIGWKLAAVLNGWGGPHLLRTYEAERRRVAEQTIASATTNLRATGRGLAHTAEDLQRTKNEEFHSLGLTLGYTYAGSPVIDDGGPADGGRTAGLTAPPPVDVETYVPSTAAGGRLPHVWTRPGRALYDDLGPAFTLLLPDDGNAEKTENADGSAAGNAVREAGRVVARAEEGKVPLTVLRRTDHGVGAHDFLLVRPDQHIAWRGARLDDIDLSLVTGHGRTG